MQILIFKATNCQKNVSYEFLSLIVLESVVKVKKKYYPQTLLEECKYETKKTKLENLINDDLEPSSSDDETKNDSDNVSDNGSENKSGNE